MESICRSMWPNRQEYYTDSERRYKGQWWRLGTPTKPEKPNRIILHRIANREEEQHAICCVDFDKNGKIVRFEDQQPGASEIANSNHP